MNILFLTMNNFGSVLEHSIYPDLIRSFAKKGNRITVLLPCEKRYGLNTTCEQIDNITVIKVKTGNLFDVKLVTKFLSRMGLLKRYKKALKKYVRFEKYDAVLSSTPPTTLYPLINSIKKRDGALSYLMLKDIFPQNAVDLEMISEGGLAHRIFRFFERRLYLSSDYIGCMSPANVKYLLKQDPWIDCEKVGICPNALEILKFSGVDKKIIRGKYDIPNEKIVFVYGGGLGKPQGIDFFVKCIKKINRSDKYMFVVIGAGPYLEELERLSDDYRDILKVIPWVPVDDFNEIVAGCDVGLIFLDNRFTIPNFPSRLLTYLQAGIPVLSATDENCDVGYISKKNGFGYWCKSDDEEDFISLLALFEDELIRREMGEKSRLFFEKNCDVDIVSDSIIRCLTELKARGDPVRV